MGEEDPDDVRPRRRQQSAPYAAREATPDCEWGAEELARSGLAVLPAKPPSSLGEEGTLPRPDGRGPAGTSTPPRVSCRGFRATATDRPQLTTSGTPPPGLVRYCCSSVRVTTALRPGRSPAGMGLGHRLPRRREGGRIGCVIQRLRDARGSKLLPDVRPRLPARNQRGPAPPIVAHRAVQRARRHPRSRRPIPASGVTQADERSFA